MLGTMRPWVVKEVRNAMDDRAQCHVEAGRSHNGQRRILHIVPQLQPGDGISSVVMNYAKSLAADGFVFDVITHKIEHSQYANAIRAMGGTVTVLPWFTPVALPRLAAMVRRYFETHRGQYEAVHCHMTNAAFMYLWEASRAGVAVRVLHSHQTRYADTVLHAMRNMPLIALGRRMATVNVACSQKAGRFLFGRQPFVVLPNAIDTRRFAFDAVQRVATRAKLGIEGGSRLYGNVGRLALQKNQDFLLEVFRLIRQRDSHARLVVLGEGPLRDVLHEKADRLDVADAVLWVPNTDHPDEYYDAMDVFLLPSLHEGLPVSLVEAQCAGLPAVVADNVDPQAVVSQVVQLPIEPPDAAASAWAARAMSAAGAVRMAERAEGRSIMAAAGFDMYRQARDLERIYAGHA